MRYNLYALPVESFDFSERFSRITKDYALVYSQTEPKNAVKLTEEDAYRLSNGDRQWLFDCNIVILAEEMKENEADICAALSEQIDELEKRLKGVDKNGQIRDIPADI